MSESEYTTPPLKTCTKCGATKTSGEFSRHSGTKDGLRRQCKVCACAYTAVYNVTHRKEIAASRAAYYVTHRKEAAASHRAWQAEHREECAEYRRNWLAEHREERADYRAAYCAEHPEEFAAYARNRRARKRNAPGVHTTADIRAQYARQNGRCFWCEKKLAKYHVDHVMPLILGGSNGKENIVIACPTCNLSKGAKHPMEFASRLL